MHDVTIPDAELNEFHLPRVCVVTGRSDEVQFRPVKFQWYPRWIAIFACAPLIAAILALALTRRVKGQLPFTDEAWSAYQRAKLMVVLAVIAPVVLFIGGLMVSDTLPPLWMLMWLTAVALPIFLAVKFVMKRGPRAVKIDQGLTHLKIPSAEAAAAIARHLSAGAVRAAPNAATFGA